MSQGTTFSILKYGGEEHAIVLGEGWCARLQAFYEEWVAGGDADYVYGPNCTVQPTPGLHRLMATEDPALLEAQLRAHQIVSLCPT